jgi:hypothetical protein
MAHADVILHASPVTERRAIVVSLASQEKLYLLINLAHVILLAKHVTAKQNLDAQVANLVQLWRVLHQISVNVQEIAQHVVTTLFIHV